MAYDGRLMRQALARFDEDKQRRAENFRARERTVYTLSLIHISEPTRPY